MLVIDSDGTTLGQKSKSEALALAREQELDLVVVAPNANPPVAKIIDYGKYQYQKIKSLQKQKKNKVGELKEVRFGMKISEHDQEIKINKIKKFLEKQHKVKISLKLIGREMAFINKAMEKFDAMVKSLSEYGQPQERPSRERNIISVIIQPK